MTPLRRATQADAPAIQAVLATDPATWALLEGAPLRPDEAEHLLAELPPGVLPGAGLGTRPLELVGEYARRGGGTALRLAVFVKNVAARRLYDRLGFQLVARRPRGAQLVDVLERPL